jgi:hypothetical protein
VSNIMRVVTLEPHADRTRVIQSVTAVLGAALPSFLLVATQPSGTRAVLLTVVGTIAAVLVAFSVRFTPPPALSAAVVVALAVASCVRGPNGSHDLWSYAMYGRILEHYHANPYVVRPAQFRGDAVLALVGWRHTVSAYGPAFLAIAAGVSRLAGTHLVALRLGFQASTAFAFVATLAVLARELRDQRAVLFVALQPVVWVSLVNGGHNDVYIALAAVVAFACFRRGWDVWAGIAIGLAALVKMTALLALPAIIVGLVLQRGWRAAFRATVGACAPVMIGIALAPRSATSAAHSTFGLVTRASPWRLPVAAQLVTPRQASTLGTLAVVVAVGWVTLRVRDRSPIDSMALGLGAFSVFASYVLPWYTVWALPVAAMSRRKAVAALLAAHAALLLAAYQARGTGAWLEGVLTDVVPLATCLAFVAVISNPVIRRREALGRLQTPA